MCRACAEDTKEGSGWSVTTKKETEKDLTDSGDKISVHLTFKKNLGNYQSMEFGAGVSITQRDGESTEDVWKRAWRITEDQLDDSVDRATKILNE